MATSPSPRKTIMHDLNQIKNLNQQAVIYEHNRAKGDAISNGYSYLAALDPLGQPDVNQKIQVFETAEQLRAYIHSTIPTYSIHKYEIAYGRNLNHPRPLGRE